MNALAAVVIGVWVVLGLIAWGSRSGHGITLRLFILIGPLGFLLPPPRS